MALADVVSFVAIGTTKIQPDKGRRKLPQEFLIRGDSRINNDLGQDRLDRARINHAAQRAESDAELQRRLQNAVQLHKAERQRLKIEEQAANKIGNHRSRERTLGAISARRSELQGSTVREIGSIHRESQARGLRGLEITAKSHLGSVESTGINDMKRLATSTNQSGHAFDFHSNSLLKNATAYVRWSAAVAATASHPTVNRTGTAISTIPPMGRPVGNALSTGGRLDAIADTAIGTGN